MSVSMHALCGWCVVPACCIQQGNLVEIAHSTPRTGTVHPLVQQPTIQYLHWYSYVCTIEKYNF